MSEELSRDRLIFCLDYWGSECRKCAEHHGYSCELGCPHQPECEQAYQQIKALIENPKADELLTQVGLKLAKDGTLMPKVSREEVDEIVYAVENTRGATTLSAASFVEAVDNIIKLLKSKGIEVEE